ncbi:MAG: molybdopterin-binding protein [Rubricoccaceae bacterium]
MSDSKPKRQPETDAERAERLRAQVTDAPTISEAEFKTKSRRSFLVGGSAALAGFLGWKWIDMQPKIDRIPALLRKNHELAEKVWRGLYRPGAMAPTFPISASGMPRANGRHGLRSEIDLGTWSMQILDHAGQEIGRMDMNAIRALPKVEMTTELKCIEGWSQIVHWGGARFSDVAAMYPEASQREYVGLATPDGEYTVGMDMASMMHAQTLLAYEMQGEPLERWHGAPLRLVTPLKYGVKLIKRIGTVQFMDTRPGDYWAERGYDWYIGH